MITTPMTIDQHPVGNSFNDQVKSATGDVLRSESIKTFQVNIGLTCNLACHHCHVESSPKRDEQMSWETMEIILEKMKLAGALTLDITGGAPEMNPDFERFVLTARTQGYKVMVRTNLTIMLHDGYRNLPEFYAQHGVHLVASLPCYLPENVNKQRGLRVYEESVDVIKKLNAVGYGFKSELQLDLVYNPLGNYLPPSQGQLEQDYRKILGEQFGINFSNLIAITNMPIGRFMHDLERDGKSEQYMQLLRESFNPHTIAPLMCRHQLHISYDGTLYDCDFNYALNIPCERSVARHIRDLNIANHINRKIVTAEHCFGCTAGSGSSCGGSLT